MALPTPFYLFLQGNIVQKIEDAESYTDTVITNYYDSETYRNELNASYVGGSNINPAVSLYNSSFIAKDDRYNATAPFPKQKSRTERKFINGAGDVVGTAWLDQIISSGALPTFAK